MLGALLRLGHKINVQKPEKPSRYEGQQAADRFEKA
jgi:hypothetical protein